MSIDTRPSRCTVFDALNERTANSQAKNIYDSSVDWLDSDSFSEVLSDEWNVDVTAFTTEGNVCVTGSSALLRLRK